MKTPIRILTIENFNPNGRIAKSCASLLRLKGCWLRDAGFPAGAQVMVKNISPGVIELRVPVSVPAGVSYITAINELNAVLNEDPKPSGTTGAV